jgi:AcrR family transcriptional regulator
METQERILLRSHDLFMRYGIRSVSMDEVATHLGMSKKTIYQFYSDKDTLVEDVINLEIKRNEQGCRDYKEKSQNALQEVFMAVDMVQELLKVMNPSVLNDLEKYHPKTFKKLNDHKTKFMYATIKDNLERGVKDGLYRQDINVEVLAKYRLVTIFLIFNPEIFTEAKAGLFAILQEITDNFLYGLVTPKGQKLIQKYKQQRAKN